MHVDDLPTPVPVIDLARVERNLAAMQGYADRHGIALRPHVKTHKLPRFAWRQVALGAVGITCQKLGEAAVMAEAGLGDILVSYPLLGVGKVDGLADLLRAAERVRVAVDSAAALETALAAARATGRPVGVLVEFDSGMRRTGVATPEAAHALARAAGASFAGLMTYPCGPATASFVAATRTLLEQDGIAMPVVSVGGTPTAARAHEVGCVTELRPGTYVYHDRMMVAAGTATLDDCALHVLATVVSRPAEDRAVLDAGSKTLSSDLLAAGPSAGYGLLPDYPEAVFDRLSEEHGMVDLSACARRPALGERVRVLPNHVCVVVNLHDAVVLAEGGTVLETVPVAARGRSR